MDEQTSNHKRIVKNTLMLYIRMILVIVVSLYTSRIVLNVLGVDDFGLVNLVTGVTAMLSFLNQSLLVSTERFLTYMLGKGNTKELKHTFSTAFYTNVLFAIIIVLILIVGGLWMINNKLVIAPERIETARILLLMSCAPILLTISNAPYSAMVIAHERMGIYAYFSIFEVLSKLAVVVVIQFVAGDKLLLYYSLFTFTGIISALFPVVYSHKQFKECRIQRWFDKKVFKEILSFSGWNLVGSFSDTMCKNGVNIVLNMFLGTVINAANGIVTQVVANVSRFTSTMMIAVNPQIIKSYAANNLDDCKVLVRKAALYGQYLFFFFAIPLAADLPFILKAWLKQVPPYTVPLIYVALVQASISLFSNSSVYFRQATGKVKKPQILTALSTLPIIVVTYILLYLHVDVVVTRAAALIFWVANTFMWQWHMAKDLQINIYQFISTLVSRMVLVVFLACIAPLIITHYMSPGWIRFLCMGTAFVLCYLPIIYFIGLFPEDRAVAIDKLKSRFHKR